MKLAELQSKTDEELLSLAIEVGAVESGGTPRRQDIIRRVFKRYSDNDDR